MYADAFVRNLAGKLWGGPPKRLSFKLTVIRVRGAFAGVTISAAVAKKAIAFAYCSIRQGDGKLFVTEMMSWEQRILTENVLFGPWGPLS